MEQKKGILVEDYLELEDKRYTPDDIGEMNQLIGVLENTVSNLNKKLDDEKIKSNELNEENKNLQEQLKNKDE